ncbi:IQ domain-containing protein M [Elgaria multicarinata webbii]|uniref:IQ domain-containing protein M n=1 Tax=Elgaria multicarinata webbii TaxID=159646 RepID=UPI002FCD4330
MMDQVSLSKIPGARERAKSAPAVLAICVDTKQSEDTPTARVLNKITLEEIDNKLSVSPYSDTWQFPRRIQPCSRVTRFDASPLLQDEEKKEKIWLSDIFTMVGSLSRTMEREKNKQKLSIGSTNLLGLPTNKYIENAWLPKNNHGKIHQDWRGVILSETMTPYTMLSNEEHQERLMRITRRTRSKGMLLLLSGKMEKRQQGSKKRGRKPYRKNRAVTIINEKVKRIGPHLEIFEAFNQKRKVPKKDKCIAAATYIQKLIRGWLDRTRMRRLKIKAKNHGPTLGAVIKEFRKMMFRIKRRCGILDPTTPLIFEQLEDWMDQKKLYETMFTKREYLKEMDRNDLPKFFRDCGLFPTPNEINNTMRLVLTDSDSKIININKTQAVEMAFMLYPPRGLKLKTAAVPRSTWLRPIVDGEDGYKYLTGGHPVLKAADIRIAGALVAASIRERKKKECEADKSVFSGDSD